MKTKLSLLKSVLLVALGMFALTSCEKSAPAMAYDFEDLPGTFVDGSLVIRVAGTALSPFGGTNSTYTNQTFVVEDASNGGAQALRFISTGASHDVDVVGTYAGKEDMMVFKAENVTYTHKGVTQVGNLVAHCKPNGFRIHIANEDLSSPNVGEALRYSSRDRQEPEPEPVGPEA